MAPKIEIITVPKGFNYAIGSLIIARSQWVKRGGDWNLRVFYLEQSDGGFGVAAVSEKIMPLNKVLGFLDEKMSKPILTKEDMT